MEGNIINNGGIECFSLSSLSLMFSNFFAMSIHFILLFFVLFL